MDIRTGEIKTELKGYASPEDFRKLCRYAEQEIGTVNIKSNYDETSGFSSPRFFVVITANYRDIDPQKNIDKLTGLMKFLQDEELESIKDSSTKQEARNLSSTPICETEFSTRTKRLLLNLDIKKIGDLAKFSEMQLRLARGIGIVTMAEIIRQAAQYCVELKK